MNAHLENVLSQVRENTAGSRVYSIDIRLFENHACLKIDGIEKAISLIDLKGILDEQLNNSSRLETIALPPNCFTIAKTANQLEFNCYYPEAIKEIKYKSYYDNVVETYRVPFPNTILYVSLIKSDNKWNLNTLKYFCTNKRVTQLPNDSLISKSDSGEGIFIMPFTNFYEDGRMCYGQNTMVSQFPENNVRGTEWYYQVIFEGTFNDDLGVKGLTTSKSAKDWYKELAEKTSFPYDLMNTSYNRYE